MNDASPALDRDSDPAADSAAALAAEPVLATAALVNDLAYAREALRELRRVSGARLRFAARAALAVSAIAVAASWLLGPGLGLASEAASRPTSGRDPRTVPTALIAVVAILPPLLRRVATARAFAADPSRDTRLTYEFRASSLRIAAPAGSSFLPYARFGGGVRRRDGLILFYGGDGAGVWLPDRAFAEPAARDAALAVVRRSVAGFREA
jgi:hypothetical protein